VLFNTSSASVANEIQISNSKLCVPFSRKYYKKESELLVGLRDLFFRLFLLNLLQSFFMDLKVNGQELDLLLHSSNLALLVLGVVALQDFDKC